MEILLVASCYRNQDKLQPVGPLGLYADFKNNVNFSKSSDNFNSVLPNLIIGFGWWTFIENETHLERQYMYSQLRNVIKVNG